ncbi:hypothetical protein, partial [Haloferula sp.]|uniref:hypothetical protein n=1 Tax=Haloferula sp. TaxID=2497595 RepID=UPI003C795A74
DSFRCFPPRLAATQLLPVLSPDAPEAGRSLPLRRVLALRGARSGTLLSHVLVNDDRHRRIGRTSVVTPWVTRSVFRIAIPEHGDPGEGRKV